MLESYIRTGDGKDYVDVDCVREALGIKEDENIFRAIEKLREKLDAKQADFELTDRLYKENRAFVNKLCEAVDIQRPYLESGYDKAVKLIAGFKRERDELKEDKDLLEELHANHISQLNDYAELASKLGIESGDAESIKDYIVSLKRERDELKEKHDKLKARANAMYGTSCGYSGDKASAFRCNVISYSWEFEGGVLRDGSIRVELDLTPNANYKGAFDMEDLRRYIQEYGREKKLGVIESVDYQNAKAARAELAHLYETVLGKGRPNTNLSPHEVMKAILDEYKRRKEFLRELSCSLGFGDPVVTPDNIDQKEKDILERIEGLKAGVWPCENSSTFAEYLRKEFPELCKEYNVAPLTEGGSVRDWIKYIFENLADYRELTNINFRKAEEFRKEKRALSDSLAELRSKIREIYRSIVDDELDEGLSYTSALNDINEEYKRVVRNFEERTEDWSKAQQEYSRYRLAVGSLLDIPKEARGNINAIERSFTFSKKKYESLKEFRDNVCEIFDIPSSMADNYILKEIHDIADRYDELEDFRADICGALDIEGMLGTPKQNDKYILEQVEKLKGDNTSLDRYARLRSSICTALCLGGEASDEDILEQVKALTNRCNSLEDLRQNVKKFRKKAIEDLKNRDFLFRPEEDEDIPEIFVKLLERYDVYFSRYKEQFGLRREWHMRYESEHERANGVQKALDRELEKCRVKDISLETAKKQYEKVCNNLETAECALNGMRNKVRELQKEKTKVISALGQDIWDDCLK